MQLPALAHVRRGGVERRPVLPAEQPRQRRGCRGRERPRRLPPRSRWRMRARRPCRKDPKVHTTPSARKTVTTVIRRAIVDPSTAWDRLLVAHAAPSSCSSGTSCTAWAASSWPTIGSMSRVRKTRSLRATACKPMGVRPRIGASQMGEVPHQGRQAASLHPVVLTEQSQEVARRVRNYWARRRVDGSGE